MLAPLALWISVTGCVVEDDRTVELPMPPGDARVVCEVPPELETTAGGSILIEGDIRVSTMDELREDCAAGRPWRGFARMPAARERAMYGFGVSGAGAKWPNARVAYDIDSNMPNPSRITDAIADWEASTSLRFHVKGAGDTDYVHFTSGSSCFSDSIGRTGGQQIVSISTGASATNIVGSAIAPSGDVYTWFSNGIVMAGSSSALDSSRETYAFTLPPGYTASQIVGMAISPATSDVYAWYSDGKVSSGTSFDLDTNMSPVAFTLPPGKLISQIIDMDFNPSTFHTFTWFSDGTVAEGSPFDLDLNAAPVAFSTAAGEVRANLRGLAFAATGTVYAWYSDKKASAGSPTDLDTSRTVYDIGWNTFECATYKVVHEIGHAIGLQHEQRRTDRDSFVRVFLNNIDPTKTSNFDKGDPGVVNIGAYDVTSRMHYESYGFSTNGSPTLLALTTRGASVPAGDVVDMAISPSSDVYTWWTDGTVTSGQSDDLEATRSRYTYDLPSGYLPTDIVGIGIAPGTSNTYTWYRDGKRSIGETADLDSVSGPAPYTLPAGYTTSDIIAIDIAPSSHVYVWYDDGKVSSGTSTDLDAYTAPTTYTLAPGRTRSQILGMAIAPSSSCYAWYTTGSASAGTSTDLDADRSLYDFRGKLALITSSTVLTAGDLAAVAVMYP